MGFCNSVALHYSVSGNFCSIVLEHTFIIVAYGYIFCLYVYCAVAWIYLHTYHHTSWRYAHWSARMRTNSHLNNTTHTYFSSSSQKQPKDRPSLLSRKPRVESLNNNEWTSLCRTSSFTIPRAFIFARAKVTYHKKKTNEGWKNVFFHFSFSNSVSLRKRVCHRMGFFTPENPFALLDDQQRQPFAHGSRLRCEACSRFYTQQGKKSQRFENWHRRFLWSILEAVGRRLGRGM